MSLEDGIGPNLYEEPFLSMCTQQKLGEFT